MSRYKPNKLIKVNSKMWYSPNEGCFRSGVEGDFIGSVLGTIKEDSQGGIFRVINGEKVSSLVWKQEKGVIPKGRIYHKNLVKADCRFSNLTLDIRECDVDAGGELSFLYRLFL